MFCGVRAVRVPAKPTRQSLKSGPAARLPGFSPSGLKTLGLQGR